eukprot:3102297-Rhodomonas_salina.1
MMPQSTPAQSLSSSRHYPSHTHSHDASHPKHSPRASLDTILFKLLVTLMCPHSDTTLMVVSEQTLTGAQVTGWSDTHQSSSCWLSLASHWMEQQAH